MLKKKEEEYMAQQAEKRKKREEIMKMAGKLIFSKEILKKKQVCVSCTLHIKYPFYSDNNFISS